MLETADWSEQDLAEFSRCVRLELGIKMPASKSLMLQSRILRRLRQLNIESLDEYRERLFIRFIRRKSGSISWTS